MSNDQAKADFQRAEQLCHEGKYQEALPLLDSLVAALPSSRRVLFQRVVCLIGLNRLDEAEKNCGELQGKIDPKLFDALRTKIGAARKQAAAKEPDTDPAPAPPPRPAAPQRPAASPPPAPAAAAQASTDTNVFQVESVFPLSTSETTITGRVVSGVFYSGDTVSVLSSTSVPLLAPIVRIGSAETPLRMIREGQQGMLVLRIEPQHVTVGNRITSSSSSEAYAETIVVAAEHKEEKQPAATVDPVLKEAETSIDHRHFSEARDKLTAYLKANAFSGAAHRLLARIHLEADGDLQNNALALEHIQKAFELGGDKDALVLETLANALGAAGRAEHGIRYLERLHSLAATDEARNALSKRIASYRTRFKLGNVWEFINSWGDVIFESGKVEEIDKAIANGSIPKDAQCRKNKTGEWQSFDQGLLTEFPQLALHFRKPKVLVRVWISYGIAMGLPLGFGVSCLIPGIANNIGARVAVIVAVTMAGSIVGAVLGGRAQRGQKKPTAKK